MMSKYLSYKISFFNFMLSVLIVVLHSNCKITLGWSNDGTILSDFIEVLSLYISCIGHIAVPMFYIISAYLFYYNISTMKSVLFKIKKRVNSLLLPYLLWNALFVLIFWSILHSPIASYLHMTNNLSSISDVLMSIINSDLTPLWFVKNLLIFVALSPIIWLIARKNLSVIILVILLSGIVVVVYEISYFNFLYWIPSYFIGILFTKSSVSHFFTTESSSCKFTMLYLIFFLLLIIFTVHSGHMYLYRIIAPMLIWKLSDYILKKYHFVPKYYWSYSFFIYCTHFFVINVIQKLLYLVLGNSNFAYITIYAVTPFLVIPLCIFMANIVNKKVPKGYKILTGNR